MKNLHIRHTLILLLLILLLPSITAACQPSIVPSSTSENTEIETTETLPEEGGKEDENIILVIEIAIGLLFIASLVGIGTQRLRVPYTVGLVLIGLVLSLQVQFELDISPNLFLAILVPPLIFEAAFHLKIRDLAKDITTILALAIPGVLFTTFFVGGVLAWGAGFSLPIALIFGALVAAIDPVAVIVLFRSIGAPKRLTVLLEGESLLNDGAAIVLFNIMVGTALTGEFNIIESVFDFFIVSGGGLIVGIVLGILISLAISVINDAMIETTLTSVLAFGSFLIAEQFHLSGVLAVVAAGIISGNLGPSRMSPSTRIMVFNFWDYAAYLANSFIFLLIGVQIDIGMLLTDWQNVLWAILAVLVARAAAVYGLSWIGRDIPSRYKHVLYWSGLRGAISLALALSLPAALGDARSEIQVLAFGVVLFTLLVQGMTMKPLITRMGLLQRSEAKVKYERKHARAYMAREAFNQLEEMYQNGYLSRHIWDVLSHPLEEHADTLAQSVTSAIHEDPDVEKEELENALEEILQTQRSALQGLLREGKISEQVYSQLINQVDQALVDTHIELYDLVRHKDIQDINRLMTIIVQEQDVENVTDLLIQRGLPVTQLSSTGAFRGERNKTLLIGYPAEKFTPILRSIKEASQEPIQVPDQEAGDEPQAIQGATLFTFDIQRYEEI